MESAKCGKPLPLAEPSAHLLSLLLGSDVEDNGVYPSPHPTPTSQAQEVSMSPVEVGSSWCHKGSVPGDPRGRRRSGHQMYLWHGVQLKGFPVSRLHRPAMGKPKLIFIRPRLSV